MAIVKVDGSDVIKLHGFEIDGEILLMDCDKMGDHKKVDVIIPEDYLVFLIEDGDLLNRLGINATVWSYGPHGARNKKDW